MAEQYEDVPDDGLLAREAGSWTTDKLAILRCYLPAFGRACRKAGRWNFADGFAGPGLNRMRDTGELVQGSPLIALNAEPAFNKCLFVDWGEQESEALRQRVQPYGGRAVVERADVNRDLVRLMQERLDPRQPCLVLLDPEGPNLEWSTVEAVSNFRVGRYKTEVLILFPTHMGFVRMLPTESNEPIAGEKLDTMFGTHEWYEIWQRKKGFSINKQQAIDKYVELYEEQLERLGYQWTMNRLIRSRGKLGKKQYHLVFATDNEAGFEIMNHCFSTVYEAKQQSLLEGFDF